MTKTFLLTGLLISALTSQAQLSPAITSWLQNTTLTGSYYMSGNPTAIGNNILVNCQKVEYSADYVYVTATGIPAYPTGPFLDGNPSQATNQSSIFQIPLNPQKNTGTPTATNGGNIGIFINGVALFDFRDGVGWNTNTSSLCGGPGNPPCPGGPMATTPWNRDAIPAERAGFDCAKGHPAMGNYHHHQNPSAFKLDLQVVSTICNLYDADGLYVIDSTQHSPLIGFAYDGFPIYGAYGYKNTDGTGGIVRMRSGYQLRNITTRTTWADGTNVADGPAVSATYYLGYFREDYEFVDHAGQEEYLDEHNGRFCITPEYPNGTYAYFATVDSNWNSAYPYIVGPTFYGVSANRSVTAVTEPTTVYTGTTGITEREFENLNISVFPNPSADLIAIQLGSVINENLRIELVDISGRRIGTASINQGSTIAYFDVQAVREGVYMIVISGGNQKTTRKVMVTKL
ncbi:MAG: YHYH protein [Bacteroidia bacterium]|nr:YHYH protein [Bacteroidia bacterium]